MSSNIQTESCDITVIRTCDATQITIRAPLSKTLNDLKDHVSQSKLGPIERNHQRLFHLGRELKSGGRSISALGIGRFHNFTLHLHSTKPASHELPSGDDNLINDTVEVTGSRKQVIDLLDDDDDEIAVVDGPSKRQRV